MEKTAKKDISQSADNALRILDCFEKCDELGITELARELGLGKASVSRLVAALEKHKFLMQNTKTGKYRLGLRLMLFGSLFQERNDIARAFTGAMLSLTKKYNATAHLACLNGADVLVINKISAGPVVYMQSRVGGTMPAHASAMGKCILAFSAPEQLENVLEQTEFSCLTENTVTDKAALMAQLNEIRRCGYALDDEEAALGLFCVGVPVLDMSGRPVAAMSVSGMKSLIEPQVEEIVGDLKTAVCSAAI